MRYCKYFIAKINEAAVLYLDLWYICICQLHMADFNEAILQTLIHFYGYWPGVRKKLKSCSTHRSEVYIRLQPLYTVQLG